MALGGGMFTTQNKVLPGTYINFISASRANIALSERGIVAMPIELDWGNPEEVLTVTNGDFQKNSLKLFGYEFGHKKLKGLADLFMHIKTLYAYRINGKGKKASNTYAEALYPGIRGNDLKTVISKNVDDDTKFDVSTLLEFTVVDMQTVISATELKANEWVTFKADATLEETASTPLTGGENGVTPTTTEYQTFLDKVESYSFNALGLPVTDETIKKLFIAFTKRMRDEVGAKFQTVVFQQNNADHEGIISVENGVNNDENIASLVYWTTGIVAGCEINKSNTNKAYDGEFDVNANYTQAQLTEALETGKFIFHKVSGEIRVLEDINTFTSVNDTKGIDFSSNQVIRVIDQIANDWAVIFNERYLGKIPNNQSGRNSLWNDFVAHHRELETMQAIENFTAEDIVVEQGSTKKSVSVSDKVSIVGAMAQLYVTCVIA